MRIFAEVATRARSLFRGRRMEAELDEEIRFHLDREIEMNLAAGLNEREARLRAALRLGGVDQVKERTRDARGLMLIEDLIRDVRIAIRSLRKSPGYSAAVVLLFAVGIGATTAVFSTADHVLLRPLPYMDPGRVVTLWETNDQSGERHEVAPGNFLAWAERNSSFEEIGLAEPWGSDLVRSDAPPEELPVWRVSEGYLEALGARIVLGRGFVEEEFDGTAYSNADLGIIRDHSGTGTSVLITEDFWRNRFGADTTLIGRSIELDGVERTVVGVLSSDVGYPEARPIWTPKIFSDLERVERTGGFMHVVGRLRPGVSLAQARADLDRISASLAAEYPASNQDTGVQLVPLEQTVLGDVRPALLMLLGAVVFLLAMASANVAGMMLARGSIRVHEVAVRSALGASRARLVSQFVTETLVIGILGGALGVFLAAVALRILSAVGSTDLPRLDEVGIDGRILGFAVAITLITAFAASLVPARRATGGSATVALRRGSRSSATREDGRRLRSALVIGQVAVALALLIGAGLLGRSFISLIETDLGFETENRVALQAFLWDRNLTAESRIQRAEEISQEMEAIPGVERVAIASSVPFHPFGTYVPVPVVVQGRPPPIAGQELQARPNIVSPEYFDVLSIPLVAGRAFSAQDREDARPVAIINETMAANFFPGEDPIGKIVSATPPMGRIAQEREIVGVVADVHNRAIDVEPTPEIFLPFAQNGFGGTIFVAQAETDLPAVIPQLRQAVWEVDPGQAIYDVSTMDDLVGGTLGPRRFSLLLLGALSLIGVVLVTIGIYGTIAYSTSCRAREIGIRMAMGSNRSQVTAMILKQGLRVGFLGVSLGLLLALLLSRFLDHLLYGVQPTDPATFTAFAVFMLLLSAVASWIPARRGARLDPVSSIREA